MPSGNTRPSSLKIKEFYTKLFSEDFFVFDEGAPYFQEKIVQIIWNEQLLSSPLTTAAGEPLEVVHPGIWNVAAGPDFHDAALFVNGQTRRGAVEVHLRPADWLQHGHQHDPAYKDTVLHVVWANPKGQSELPAGVPLFVVKDYLNTGLNELIEEHDVAGYPYARQVAPGTWAARLAELSDKQLADLFQSYGISRILLKARELGERIERHGLDEAAYQLFADGLGYKNNRKPFAILTGLLPLKELENADPETALAVLFGAAGLLPDPSRTAVLPACRELLVGMWERWWNRRREFRELSWNRQGLRPYNAPERRLLGLHLVLQNTRYRLGAAIIESFVAAADAKDALRRVRALFQVDDRAWRPFYNFEKELDKPAALLGKSRIQDLLANLAIPLYFAWCFLHNRPGECHKGKQSLLLLPRLQDNRVFKEAAHYFFVPPSRVQSVVGNACAQQGLIKLYRDAQSRTGAAG